MYPYGNDRRFSEKTSRTSAKLINFANKCAAKIAVWTGAALQVEVYWCLKLPKTTADDRQYFNSGQSIPDKILDKIAHLVPDMLIPDYGLTQKASLMTLLPSSQIHDNPHYKKHARLYGWRLQTEAHGDTSGCQEGTASWIDALGGMVLPAGCTRRTCVQLSILDSQESTADISISLPLISLNDCHVAIDKRQQNLHLRWMQMMHRGAPEVPRNL